MSDNVKSEIYWKERAAKLEQDLRVAQDKLDHARTRRAAVLERLHRYERARLQPEVLRHLLPARAAAWRRRAPDPAAAAREDRHAAACERYRVAISRGAQPPAGADHVHIDGLDFWIPTDARVPGRLADDLLQRQWLPLRQILQTREAVGGGIMLDVGANIGTTTIPRAVLGDYSIFYAAEPDPDNFASLVCAVVRNALNGVVLPDQCAISGQDGWMRLRRSTSIGGHRLDPAAEDGVEVAVHTLQSWVLRLGIDVEALRFIKIDTQGHEAHVLAGAGPLLGRPGIVWQLEFSPRHLRLAGRSAEDAIAQLQQWFTWFVDLYAMAPGARVRPIAELPEALAYLGDSFTDLLVYRTAAA